jgi:hypothetical protein
MAKRSAPSSEEKAIARALADSADDDQGRCLYLMWIQVDRGDMALVEMLAAYGRVPRPAPQEEVALDLGLFNQLRVVCGDDEHAAWTGLLIGAAMRGDGEGMALVEEMTMHRLSR